MISPVALKTFFDRQIACWPQAAARYADLAKVDKRIIEIGGFPVILQHNPLRAVSTNASVDAVSVASRPCFLCRENRPAEQIVLDAVEGYDILVNPYPIFPMHFTISAKKHRPQCDVDLGVAMDMALHLHGFVVFFNGASAGASAPDHLHLQAGNSDFLPIVAYAETHEGELMSVEGGTKIFAMDQLPMYAVHFISDTDFRVVQRWIDWLLPDDNNGMPNRDLRNLLFWADSSNRLHTLFFPRIKHRPDRYYAVDDSRMLVSPGAVDMSGVLILPRCVDFERMSRADVINIYDEVGFRYKDSPRLKSLLLL